MRSNTPSSGETVQPVFRPPRPPLQDTHVRMKSPSPLRPVKPVWQERQATTLRQQLRACCYRTGNFTARVHSLAMRSSPTHSYTNNPQSSLASLPASNTYNSLLPSQTRPWDGPTSRCPSPLALPIPSMGHQSRSPPSHRHNYSLVRREWWPDSRYPTPTTHIRRS